MGPRARTAAPLGVALALGALGWRAPARVAALFPGGDAPVTVGPTPPSLRGVDAVDCGRCHADIAAEWGASAHALAWRDPLFQRAYAREPQAFCRHCHAPRMAPGAARPDPLAAREGVSCAVCHVREGQVLGSASGRHDVAPGRGAHPVTRSPELATSDYCGGCHQFDFPVDPASRRHPGRSGEPMQDTLGEWSRSDAAARGRRCQDCHMPLRTAPDGRRWRSHAFHVFDDVAALRGAVRVEVTALARGDRTVVTARLTPDRIGHAFPTGDLFRQAALAVWREGDGATRRTELLTRRYGVTRSRRRTEVADTRVPPPGPGAARTLRFELPGARCAPVRWRLEHLRMPVADALRDGVADADNRTLVAEGSVAPQGSCSGATSARPGD